MGQPKLNDAQREALKAEIKKGDATNAALGEKYGMTASGVYWIRRTMADKNYAKGRPSQQKRSKKSANPPDMDAFNADILAGMSEKDLCTKWGLGRNTMYAFKRKIKEGKAEVSVAKSASKGASHEPMSVEAAVKIINLLAKLAAKHPGIIEELEILPRLVKKHSALLIEVLI